MVTIRSSIVRRTKPHPRHRHIARSLLELLRRGLLSLRALLLLPVEVLVGPRETERILRAEALLLLRDRARLLLQRLLWERDDLLQRVLRHVLRLRTRRVALLRLVLPRQHHQLALVQLQASDVLLQALGAAVLAAVVHADADRASELLGDPSLLELIQREPAAQADLRVVALRHAVDRRAQLPSSRARRDLRRLLLARRAAALLTAGLVEPSANVPLPPLLVMDVREDLVVLHDRELRALLPPLLWTMP